MLWAQQQLAGLLERPGCIFCREGATAVDRFFFWYLADQYGSPESLELMRRAGGFCPAHTRMLVTRAPASTVAWVYEYLIHGALARLKAGAASPTDAQPAPCPACASAAGTQRYLIMVLDLAVAERSWEERLIAARGLCLFHFQSIAAHLSWEGLRQTAAAVRAGLQHPDRWAVPSTVGQPPARSLVAAVRAGGWSPALDDLQRRLGLGSCVACERVAEAGEWYERWLSEEILTAPPAQWDPSLYLCHEHADAFAASGSAQAVAAWRDRLVALWLATTEHLLVALRERPRSSVGGRLYREWQAERRPGRTGLGRLPTIVRAAWPSVEAVLARRRAAIVPTRPCPVCTDQRKNLAVLIELVAVGLGDERTWRAYDRALGICYRHLPALVLAASSDLRPRVLHHQSNRLAVIAWELGEFLRKQNWDRRHEPKGYEQTAWRRAVEQFSGTLSLPRADP